MDKKKILIVDDEQNIRLMVGRILGKDYIVLEAADGKEALDNAKSQQPDLILMDLMMPRVDGYTACFRIKADQATKAIPVIMLTGVDHVLNKKFAQEMGADGYITKPFSPNELLEVISRLLKLKRCFEP